jgi:hypothetical protein
MESPQQGGLNVCVFTVFTTKVVEFRMLLIFGN